MGQINRYGKGNQEHGSGHDSKPGGINLQVYRDTIQSLSKQLLREWAALRDDDSVIKIVQEELIRIIDKLEDLNDTENDVRVASILSQLNDANVALSVARSQIQYATPSRVKELNNQVKVARAHLDKARKL